MLSDDQAREAILKIILTAITGRIREIQKQNSKTIVKPYMISIDNNTNRGRLCNNADNIIGLKLLLAKTSEEESKHTAL